MAFESSEISYQRKNITNLELSDISATINEVQRNIDKDRTVISTITYFNDAIVGFFTSGLETRGEIFDQTDVNVILPTRKSEEKEVDIPIFSEESIFSYEENIILNQLLDFSSKLKHAKEKNKRIDLILNLNEFIKKNKNIIRDKFPDVLVSILNSF